LQHQLVIVNSTAITIPWVAADDWTLGVILFLLGVVGAAVTVYLSLGGFLPNINRSARMIELEATIKLKSDRITELEAAKIKDGK
jgi:hypothetical protein